MHGDYPLAVFSYFAAECAGLSSEGGTKCSWGRASPIKEGFDSSVWRLQILVLGFCDSQSDLEVVQKILSQARSNA